MIKRLGIMGGTFDPIHNAHLMLAQYAAAYYNLEKVLFVVSPNPPHKTPTTSANKRVEMVSLAICGNNLFELSTIEIDRGGVSYTVDTIRQLQHIYGSNCDMYLILGSDEAASFMSWHKPMEIASCTKVVCANRPGGCGAVSDIIEKFDMPETEISSTEIRNRLRTNKSIKYLLPDKVADYIIRNGLYGGKINNE